MKRLVLFVLMAMIGAGYMFAQADVADLLKAGVNDANVLAKPYLKPYGEMLGKGLNNGWYNSAKIHKKLGFDVTFTASYIMAPSSVKTFDISQLSDKLETYELVDPNNSIAPTVAGDMDNLPVLTDKLTNLSRVEMPNGSGMGGLPVPMISAGIGLPKGIEVKARFVPTVDIGDAGKIDLMGIGVQKDLKDYIPGVKHIPVLNVSALVAYTKFSSEIGVDEALSDGMLEVSASGLTTRLIVGANLPVVALYAGAGYGRTSSDFDLLGTYAADNGLGGTINVSNPISLGYTTSGFDANVGLRIRLGVIALHADYTLGDYSALTAGFGISLR